MKKLVLAFLLSIFLIVPIANASLNDASYTLSKFTGSIVYSGEGTITQIITGKVTQGSSCTYTASCKDQSGFVSCNSLTLRTDLNYQRS